MKDRRILLRHLIREIFVRRREGVGNLRGGVALGHLVDPISDLPRAPDALQSARVETSNVGACIQDKAVFQRFDLGIASGR